MYKLKIKKRFHTISLRFLIGTIGCWIGTACSRPLPPPFPELEKVPSLSAPALDSLAFLLEREVDLAGWPDSSKAYYGLLLTYVHQLQGRSLVNDTMIYQAVDYFRQNNPEHLGKAYQLAIEQQKWKKNGPAEMESLLERAVQDLRQRDDSLLPPVLTERMLYNYKIYNWRKADEYARYLLKAYPADCVYFTYMLGLNYNRAGMLDSCLYYVKDALEIAYAEKDTGYIQHISRIYATMLAGDKGAGKEALTVIRRAQDAFPASDYPYHSPSALAWYALGNLDSMSYYLSQIKDADMTNTAFRMMYQTVWNAQRGLPVSSPFFSIQDSLLLSTARAQKTEKELWLKQNEWEYKAVNLKNENLELQRNLLWIAIGGLSCLVFLIWRYQRLLVRKERIIYEERDRMQSYVEQLKENEILLNQHEEALHSLSGQLSEKERVEQERARLIKENALLQTRIDQYARTLQAADRGKRFLADLLIAQSPVLRKLTQETKYIDEARWPGIVEEVDRLHNRYTRRLQNDYPALTEQDVRACCLILLHFSTASMGIFLGISGASVTKRKQRIKERMAQTQPRLWEYEKSLETYLWHY